MIIFRNPGLIDLKAATTLGVNVKVQPGAFGYFGTGLKFAIATILRNGGSITLYRGERRYDFGLTPTDIRGEAFNIVHIQEPGQPALDLGFTDQLGRNWQPWMVLRELGCNADDENGSFFQLSDPESGWDGPADDETTFIVTWDALDEAFKLAHDIFYDHGRTPLISNVKLQVAEGPSDFLFYRGIRAMKLERQSHFTYNIISEQTLTEDRNLAHSYYADAVVRQFWMGCQDPELVKQAITTGNNFYEAHLRFDADEQTELSRTFIDAALDLRDERNDQLSVHAKQAMLKAIRREAEEETYYGGSHGRRRSDNLTFALETLGELFDSDDIDWSELQVVTIDDDATTAEAPIFLERERIYVKRSAPRNESVRTLAMALLKAVLEREWQLDKVEYLGTALMDRHRATRIEREPEPEPAPAEDPTLSPADA